MRSHNGACGAPGGINKAAWGTKLLLTSASTHAMVWVHCGCFCQLLNKNLGAWVSSSLDPSTHPPPPSHPLTHLLTHDAHDYLLSFSKTFHGKLARVFTNFRAVLRLNNSLSGCVCCITIYGSHLCMFY